MHVRLATIATLLTTGVLFSACHEVDPVSPGHTAGLTDARSSMIVVPDVPVVCHRETFDLLAGRDLKVGTVAIGNDEETLYVTYEVSGAWKIAETHLAVVTDLNEIPRMGQGIALGKFPGKSSHAPPVTVVHHAMPLADLDGTSVIVAAHADVVNEEGEEGAWVEGSPISESGSWASYAAYELADCSEVVREVIGSDGGSIEADGGNVVLDIPEGALEEDVELTVAPAETSELPEGAIEGTAFDFGPDGQEFAEPVTITVHYDETQVTDEENLSIHLLRDDIWEKIPSIVNTAENVITAEVTHFSVYAVVPSVASLEIVVDPQPVPEGEQVRYEVWLRNITSSTTLNPEDFTVEFTLTGDVALHSYSTGLCDLTETGSTFAFTCSVAFSFPGEPGQAHIHSFTFIPESGSEGTSIDAFASFTHGNQTATTGISTTDIVAPLTSADLDVLLEMSAPEVTVGDPLTHLIHVVNGGPASIEGAELTLEVVGDVIVQSMPADCLESSTSTGVVVTCTVPPLDSGFGEAREIVVSPQSVPTGEGALHSIATVTELEGATDPNLANNSDEAFTVVNPP